MLIKFFIRPKISEVVTYNSCNKLLRLNLSFNLNKNLNKNDNGDNSDSDSDSTQVK